MSSCSIFGWKYFNCSIIKFFYGILLFMLRIYNNLRFGTFHYRVLKKTYKYSWYLVKTRRNHPILKLYGFWSQEKYSESTMAPKMVGIKYSSDTVIRAFGYFATLRTLHNRLRDDFQLPSLAALRRMTSKVSKLNEKSLLLSIFNTLIILLVKKGA